MTIEPRDVLPLLQRLEVEPKLDAAARVRTFIGQILRYGIATGRAARDASVDLHGAVATPQTVSHAAILDPAAFYRFLAACDAYTGHAVTVIAIQLAPLVVLRSSELREGRWPEVDFDAKTWRIPKACMKGRDYAVDHIVPLSDQAILLLDKLRAITGRRTWMFETSNSPGQPMSENTINQGFRRLGYLKEEVTLHGGRTTFSTFANEAADGDRRRWESDWIERQLGHLDGSVRGVYNAAEYLGPRRRLLRWWSNECDRIRGYAIANRIRVAHSGRNRVGDDPIEIE